jgi:iron uptake system component EfeO
MPRPATALVLPTLLTALVACSSDAASGDGVAVQAGDSSCTVADTELDAGSTTFAVKNTGNRVTEVYVYGQEGDEFSKVVSEVENIGPGTSRDMTVKLVAGTYEIACKPGQTGDGIRTRIVVGGGSSASADATAEAKYDREIELSTDGNTISGLTSGATKGEKIEFKLENNADGERTLEIKKPSGAVAGEAEDIEPGAEGEVIIELDVAGTWQVIVEGTGLADVVAELAVS